MNLMDYYVWDAMLESYCNLKSKPKTIAEVKEALLIIWRNLPHGAIDKAVKLIKLSDWKLVCWSLELAMDTLNICSDNEILAFDH